jgi:hypothetical protein
MYPESRLRQQLRLLPPAGLERVAWEQGLSVGLTAAECHEPVQESR